VVTEEWVVTALFEPVTVPFGGFLKKKKKPKRGDRMVLNIWLCVIVGFNGFKHLVMCEILKN
jgi:hypothetical protein